MLAENFAEINDERTYLMHNVHPFSSIVACEPMFMRPKPETLYDFLSQQPIHDRFSPGAPLPHIHSISSTASFFGSRSPSFLLLL